MPSPEKRITVTGSGSFSLVEPMDFEDEYPSGFAQDAEQFARAFDVITNPSSEPSETRQSLLNLADVYYEIASRKLSSARGKRRKSSRALENQAEDALSQDSMDLDDAGDGEDPASDEELQRLESEAQTWDLLRRLLPLRYSGKEAAQPKRKETTKYQTSAELWDEFLQSDSTAQERKAILEVLQEAADDKRDDIDDMVRELQQKAERGEIIAFGWLHTRAAIKMNKKVNGWAGALDPSSADIAKALYTTKSLDPLVTQLDPDVVTRQNRKLEPGDEYFERAIWLGCYEFLRRGRSLDEIRDWCVERTEVWRAMSMSAMPLSRDSNQGTSSANATATLLWRRTCFALARQGGTDDFERAVYGILSGDIPSVEKICESWDDFVFAHYNALLRTQFDNYILKRSPAETTQAVTSSFPAFNAIQFHGDAASAGERLVGSLESNPKTSKEARTPMKSLQGAVISNTLQQYVYNDGLALGRQANAEGASALIPDFSKSKPIADIAKYFPLDDPNGLRLLVHVYLLISKLDQLEGNGLDPEMQKTQENVLAAYVSILRLGDMVELLPVYCAMLQGERAFFTLSRNASSVVDMDERRTLLRIMERLGMDIAEFVVFQPESLLKEHSQSKDDLPLNGIRIFSKEPFSLKFGRRLEPDFFGEPAEHLDPVDEQLIQSLEWMMLVDGLWDETFKVGVAIYKRFLKSQNLHAARALSERVPCVDIFRIKGGQNIQDDADLSWFDELEEAGISLEGTIVGPIQMVAARNYLELESLVRALDSIETVASSVGIAADPATTSAGRDFWTHMGIEIKKIKAFMVPLLGTWLKESLDAEDAADFEFLRDMYLPETILSYVSVLHVAGNALSRDYFLEAMEIAALIAEKDSEVAATLMKNGRMKELVEAFANCSKALAINTTDKRLGGSGSSKKMRELGWARDLWTVKP